MSAHPARTWLIAAGVLLLLVQVLLLLAWWQLPRWQPEWVVAHAPWPEPALRAWRIDAEDGDRLASVHLALERRLLDWGPAIGPALVRQFAEGDAKHRLAVVALASEVARADGIAAGTTLPMERRQQFTQEDIQALREDLVQLVLVAMADGSSYLPSNASYVAMSLRDPRVVPPACAFLATQKPPIFEDLEPVIRFLGSMRDARAVPALIPLLPIRHKPHPTVEEALDQCLADGSVEHVIAATRHAHEVVRTWAARIFPRFAQSVALRERIIALISDHERQVAIAAITALTVQAPQASSGPALEHTARQTTDEQIRQAAITGLGRIRHAPALPFLRELAHTGTGQVRAAAAAAIAAFGEAVGGTPVPPAATSPP